MRHQCEILGVNRSGLYYKKVEADQILKEEILAIYVHKPFYGYRRMTVELRRNFGKKINKKRVLRIMQKLGLHAIYPKPDLSKAVQGHKKYPYLLKGLKIERVNQVWETDITYIKVKGSNIYLVAIIDVYSRKILSFRLSNTMDKSFCIAALNEALLKYGSPEIFNSDQGSQFTSNEFLEILEKRKDIKISMDSKGRALDNIYIERVWRSLKYENIYLNDYKDMKECKEGIKKYFEFYNGQRWHQSINYRTPNEVYFEGLKLIKGLNEVC